MNRLFIVLSLLSATIASPAQSENIADRLIGTLIEKKLPAVLYQHKDKPWELGTYSLTVKKTGQSNFSSSNTALQAKLPLQVIISGKIQKDLFGTAIMIGCNSQFYTHGTVNITPEIKPVNSQADVLIDIPIPNPQLNCDGLIFPIKEPLEQLIAEEKVNWQQDIRMEIGKLFQQAGM